MESPAKRSGRQGSRIDEARRNGPTPSKRTAAPALEVTDVVRHGMGRGSRVDLTIVSAGHRVRLTGLAAKHVLNYSRIEKAAVEEGVVLPYFRFANRTWRKVLSPAMEQARIEPWLEGEEIAGAIAEEIRALLGGGRRGECASDLAKGKGVEREGHLLVSPTALVEWVRRRLVDDSLPQATIAEAARAGLGMRKSRPRFADCRPHAWAFPLPLAAAGGDGDAGERLAEGAWSKRVEGSKEPGVAPQSGEQGGGASEAKWIRSMDRRADPASLLWREGSEVDPLDRENGVSLDPVHRPTGSSDISPSEREIAGGSNGPRKESFAVDLVRGTAVPSGAFTADESHKGSNGAQNGRTKLRKP